MSIRRVISMLLAMVMVLMTFAGCMTHTHVIGNGPAGSTEQTETQWFALWGLVPINEVDTNEMAEGATDYTIVTEVTPLDAVIDFFTSIVTVYRRSVTVIR